MELNLHVLKLLLKRIKVVCLKCNASSLLCWYIAIDMNLVPRR